MADVVTFDPVDLRVIEINTGLPVNELSLLEIYSEWKDWLLADPTRMGYPQAFRVVGGDPISGTSNLGSTFFLTNGWRIRPAEYSHKLVLAGNVFTDPAGSDISVPTLGAYNVTVSERVSNLTDAVLLNSPDIQYSSFDGAVSVNPTTGVPGTEFPIGTPRVPVDNLTDALAIAQERGFRTLLIHGNMTVDSGLDFNGKKFEGHAPNHTILTIDPAASVVDCEFTNATIEGTLDGGVRIVGCVVNDVNYVDGTIDRCLLAGTITLSGSAEAHILDCWDGITGLGTPIIDCGGSGTNLNVRRYSGGLALRNKTGSESASIDGQIRLVVESTVTNGTILVRGVGSVQDDSTGSADVISTDLVNPETVANAVWEEPIPGHAGISDSAAKLVYELFKLAGLDPTKPLVVTATTRRVPGSGADIDQTVDESAGTVTVTRV